MDQQNTKIEFLKHNVHYVGKQCAPYQMPNGELIEVWRYHPKEITLTLVNDKKE